MAQQSVYESTLQTIRAQQQARAQQDAQAQQAAQAAAAEAERTRDRTAGEFAKDTALTLSAGVGGLLGTGYGLANAVTLGNLDKALDGAGTQFFDDFGNAMSEAKSAPLQARAAEGARKLKEEGIASGLAYYATTPSLILDMGVQTLPYLYPPARIAAGLGGVARAGALAKGVSEGAAALVGSQKATQAALVANAAIGGGMMNVDAINAARDAGLSDTEQQLAGLGGFAAGTILSAGSQKLTGSAALEAGFAQRLAGQQAPSVAGNLLGQVGMGVAREGAQEAIEEGGQQVIRNVAGQQPWETGVGESAALGGLLGGVFGGVFGAANVRQPTQTRGQLEAMIASQQAELNAVGLGVGPRPLNDMMKNREQAQQQVNAQEQQFQADLAADETVQETLARQQFPEFEEVEDIDVGVIVPPPPTDIEADIDLAAAVPPGLSGLNRVVAEQRAARAGQPPRMGVQEIPFDQFAPPPEGDVAGLPQVDEVGGRSLQDIIRSTAPIERVAQQFGAAAAGAEAGRRATAAQVEQPRVDVSTPAARGAYNAAVKNSLAQATGLDAKSFRGTQFAAISDRLAAAGVPPGTPEFDALVGAEAAKALGQVERAGGQSNVLGALVNAYPVTEEQRVEAAFDTEGVPTTEAELFGNEPAAPTGVPLIPAADVKAGAVGQVWVDGNGNELRVVQAPNAGKTVLVEGADGTRRGVPLSTARKEKWQLQGTPVVEGLDNAAVAQLRDMLAGTYWSETGGRLLRTDGDQGEVTGRTSWLSSNPEAQAVLSNTGYSAADVQGWLDRAATGQGRPLGEKQVAIVSGLLDVLREQQAAVQPADANKPSEVTMEPTRYNAADWADYLTYPGARQLNALVQMKEGEGNPQPVLAAMLYGIDLAGDLTELGQLSNAAQAHPEFSLMPQDARSEVSNHIATAVNRITGATFELAGAETKTKTIPKSLFDKGIAKAEANYGRPIIGVETTADLQIASGVPVPPNAKGMFYNDNIYVVRANIKSGKDLAMTVAHEVGHSGLAALLGPSLNAATNRMWANSDMRKRIKAKQADLNMAQGTETERRASRTLAAEEVLADMLASGERLNKDIWSKLRAGVREFFARVFGMRDYVLTNADVDALLSDVARVVNGAAAGQVASDMANAEMWFSNPTLAATQDPKFSKARADLEATLAAAQNEPYSDKLPMGHILKAAIQTGIDSGKRVKSRVNEGSTGSFLRTWFMGLDTIVDWNDKLFNPTGNKRGGLLKKFYNLKEAKDAQFNRLNAKKEDRTYTTVRNGVEVKESVGTLSVNDVIDSWYSFQRSNPAKSDLLDFVLTDGTYYQVFPDRSWEDQVTDKFDYEAHGYTEAERKEAHNRVRTAYNAVGEEGRTLYKQAQAVYAQRFAQYYDSIVKETVRIGEAAKADAQVRGLDVNAVTARVDAATKRYKDSLAGIISRSKSGPYSPLQRYGDHLVTVRDAAGDVVFFAGYQSRAEADAAAAEIETARKEAGEQVVINIGTPQTTDLDAMGASKQDLAAIRAEVIGMLPEGMDPDLYDTASAAIISGLAEVYLQSLPAKSFAKHALRRKNVAGYDSDTLRSFSNYVMRSARTVANIQHDGQIGNAMTEVQQYVKDVGEGKYTDETGVVRTDTQKLQSVANSVKTQHLAAERVEQNKIVNAATAVAFTFQLTSPSHMFMNATQTMFVSFPRLAGVYGGAKANREIMRAMKEYTQSGTDMLSEKLDSQGKPVATLRNSTNPKDAILLSVLEQIRADGPLDITQAHDAAGIADGSATELSPYAGKVMKWLSIPMHKSEVFNRQIVGAAAVRLELDVRLNGGTLPTDPAARAALIADLVNAGKEAIRTTQFNYSQFNKARSMQSPTGKLLLQYKTYQFNMLAMIAKDIRDAELGRLIIGKEPINKEEAAIARSTLAYVLGMQLAFTGAVGTILAPFVFAAMDAFRDDEDLLSSKDEFLVWGTKMGIATEILSKGLFSPLLDTARIEAGTLIPILGQGDYAPEDGNPRDSWTYYVTQNLGPAAGLSRNIYVGIAELFDGEVEKGVAKLLPKPAADAWKFAFEAPNGVRDAKGIVYFEPNPFDLLMGVAGFRSGDRRDAEAQRSRLYSATTTRFDVRDRYLQRLALAQSAGDRVGVAEAMADIQSWNSKYPDLGFKRQEITGAIRQRAMSERNAEQYGVSVGGTIRPSIAEAAGL